MPTKSSSPDPPAAVANDSKKRKSVHEELTVDLSLPEPPSKKARRALKKGKALPPKPTSDDESSAARKKKSSKSSSGGELTAEDAADDNETLSNPKRSEHGVWIGNLYFATTQDELTEFLISNSGGAISKDNITRVKMPTSKKTGRDGVERVENKGFAYMDFDTAGPMYAAITLSESELGRRKLLIKDAKSFAGRPKKETAAPAIAAAAADGVTGKESKGSKNEHRKIYVGNLPFEVTEHDLKQHFDKCGEIAWVKVATFEDSGKCKGYGWVNFVSPEAAQWAVKGFIKIKEEELTEDDFKDKGDDAEEDEDTEKKQEIQKKVKTRKWWTNRIMGRQLKIEFAEDDQTRYKKRFGKDAPSKRDGDKRDKGNNRTSRGEDSAPQKEGKREPEPLKMSDDINVARLTGGMVESKGKKITFD